MLATKVGNPMDGDPTRRGLSRRWITQACDDSLRRLGVDHIDLYQLHRPDPETPIGETLEVLGELVTAGKVRAIGTSTFSAVQLRDTLDTATALGVAEPTSEQPPYSVARPRHRARRPAAVPHRGHRRDLLGTAQRRLADRQVPARRRRSRQPGEPPGRALRPQGRGDAARRSSPPSTRSIAVADDVGLTLPQLALGFVLDDPTVTAAIIGPRTLGQLTELLATGAPALPARHP